MYFEASFFCPSSPSLPPAPFSKLPKPKPSPRCSTSAKARAEASYPHLDARSLMKRAYYYNGWRRNPSLEGLACHGDDVCNCESNGECCIFGYRQQHHDCGRPNSKIV
ncbi:hypothetical protein CPB97_010260 [Podila verticillata]|nr:hypothetical protein CPB97_010260 [Podila verticillata]